MNEVRQYYPPIDPLEPPKKTGAKKVWLETPVTVSTTITTYTWAWFDASKFVPKDATGLILYAECVKSGVNVSVLEVRASKRLPAIKVLYVTGALTSCNFLTLPLDQREYRKAFQHEVTTNSFGTSIALKIVGYTRD